MDSVLIRMEACRERQLGQNRARKAAEVVGSPGPKVPPLLTPLETVARGTSPRWSAAQPLKKYKRFSSLRVTEWPSRDGS